MTTPSLTTRRVASCCGCAGPSAGGEWLSQTLSAAPAPSRRRLAPAARGYTRRMLLIIGIILLVIAIAGGVIVHPVLFALAIVAIVLFFMGRRPAV